MKYVNQSNNKISLASTTPMEFLEALIVRELQNLAAQPQLSHKEIITLERLGGLLMKVEGNKREEYYLLVKAGIKGDEANSQVLKEIEKLLLNSPSQN